MDKSLENLTDKELWQLFPVILSEHNEEWARQYLYEKDMLIAAAGKENIVRVSHIGSTAVPGLVAKPTIDILLEINNKTDAGRLQASLLKSGYICNYRKERPAPHLMCMKGYSVDGFKGQAYHLHVRYKGDWDELYFRDYLLMHPEIAVEYGKLKTGLQIKFEYDRDAYTEAKAGFIKKITKLARMEFSGRYKV